MRRSAISSRSRKATSLPTGPGLPITGYGLCNGLGRNAREVREALGAGQRGFSDCPFDVPFTTVCGVVEGELPSLPPGHGSYDSRLVRLALLGMEGLAAPLQSAIQRWGPSRVAMIMSTSTGGIGETEIAYDHYCRTGALPAGYDFAHQHSFCAFVDVLRAAFGVTGPRYVISTACSSSGKVFSAAQRLIHANVVDTVVVGGVDSLCLTTVRGFHSLGVLSSVPCRPFAAARPGMNIGEGAAFALVEREGQASVYLLGVGETSDAFHMSAPDPEGRGARAAMIGALRAAEVEPNQVDYINAHGTGTAANDVAEAKAIQSVFGDQVPVASTKGYTGHTLGACGGTEAIFTIMAIEEGWIPASLGAAPLDPDVRINIAIERIDRPVRFALSNSFAFGGNNVSVLFGGAT